MILIVANKRAVGGLVDRCVGRGLDYRAGVGGNGAAAMEHRDAREWQAAEPLTLSSLASTDYCVGRIHTGVLSNATNRLSVCLCHTPSSFILGLWFLQNTNRKPNAISRSDWLAWPYSHRSGQNRRGHVVSPRGCPRAYLWNQASHLRQMFDACYLRLALGFVVYFRFYGSHYACTLWPATGDAKRHILKVAQHGAARI